MAITAIQAVQEALKSYFLPGLRYQLNEKTSPFLAQLEQSTDNVVGKEIRMALRYGRSGGHGNRTDDGDLPTPNSRKTKQAVWETKNLYSRFMITDKTIEASKTSVGAFASLLEQEIKDLENDAKFHLNRQILGDGSGKLCTVKSASFASNVLTITVDNTVFLAEGMIVDVYDASASGVLANGSGLEIISVDDATKNVGIACATNIASAIEADADYLVVSGNAGMELTGIGLVLKDTGSIYGLNRTTYPWLKPQLVNLTAPDNELSENIIQTVIDQIQSRSGSVVNYIQCSLGVRRAYIDYLGARKQITNTLELKGGWQVLAYSSGDKNIPIVGDKYLPEGTMDLFDLNDWKLYHMGDFTWMDRDGAILHRVANKPAWEATLVRYCDLGCQRPRGQGRITGIKEH